MSVKEPGGQEKELAVHEVAAAPAEGSAGSSKSLLNQQFTMLNSLRRARTWVDVYLITGTCLHGQIKSFDTNMLLLQTRTGDVALYHHAISSVIRAQKRAGAGKGSAKPGTASKAPRKSPVAGSAHPGELGHVPSGRPPRIVSLDRPPREPRPFQEDAGDGDASRPSRPRLGAVRRPAEVPPGVVVVRHKRVRTIVKPEDADS